MDMLEISQPSLSVGHSPRVSDEVIPYLKSLSLLSFNRFYVIDCINHISFVCRRHRRSFYGVKDPNVSVVPERAFLSVLPAEIRRHIQWGISKVDAIINGDQHSPTADFLISCTLPALSPLNRKPVFVNHHLTPLKFNDDGTLSMLIGFVSTSGIHLREHFAIYEINKQVMWSSTDFAKLRQMKIPIKLNKNELAVVYYSKMGYTMREIADILCKSIDTVKTYKKNLFGKLGVNNIAEALSLIETFSFPIEG